MCDIFFYIFFLLVSVDFIVHANFTKLTLEGLDCLIDLLRFSEFF